MKSYRYKAFISYCHANERLTAQLHRSLESYRIPKRLDLSEIERKRLVIFRDRDELATSSSLGDRIEEALDVSEYLIVVCSPDAATSRWVNTEVEHFISMGRTGKILCYIVEGNPPSCFPPALTTREPLAADARQQGDGRRNARLKLIAGLLNVPFATLKDREQQRRNRRLMAITLSSIVGMAAMVALTVFALISQAAAEREAATSRRVTEFLIDLFELVNPEGENAGQLTAVDIMSRGSNRLDQELADEPLVQARLLSTIGRVYVNLRVPTEAEDHLDRALAIQRERLDVHHEDLFRTLIGKAWLAIEEADFDTAAAIYDELLPDNGSAELPNEALWAELVNDYGVLQVYLNNPSESVAAIRKALEIYDTIHESESLAAAGSWNNLAISLGDLQDHRLLGEITAAYDRSIQIIEQRRGPQHPSLIQPLQSSSLEFLQDDIDESRRRAIRAFDIARKNYGDDNLLTARSEKSLGIAHYYTARQSDDEDLARKHFQIALIHIESAAEYFVDKFGEQSHHTLDAVHFQARAYWMSGEDLPKAVVLYQQLASIINIEDAPHIFIELARVLELSGDVDSAIPVYERAMEIIRDWDEAARPHKPAFLKDYEEFSERVRLRNDGVIMQ
jgi:tetratricopeptide (TPR) repeat protein